MKPYHNEGFGIAFFWIFALVFILPIIGTLTIDDTWERLPRNTVTQFAPNVGRTLNMNALVIRTTVASLDVIFV